LRECHLNPEESEPRLVDITIDTCAYEGEVDDIRKAIGRALGGLVYSIRDRRREGA